MADSLWCWASPPMTGGGGLAMLVGETIGTCAVRREAVRDHVLKLLAPASISICSTSRCPFFLAHASGVAHGRSSGRFVFAPRSSSRPTASGRPHRAAQPRWGGLKLLIPCIQIRPGFDQKTPRHGEHTRGHLSHVSCCQWRVDAKRSLATSLSHWGSSLHRGASRRPSLARRHRRCDAG